MTPSVRRSPERCGVFLLAAATTLFSRPARADFWQILAPDALVVVGDEAPAAETAAAQKLAVRLHAAGGPADNVVKAHDINQDLVRAASHHLFVIGTPDSNLVLARIPSHWVLDRDRFYQTRAPIEPYQPTTGFFAAGYGTFKNGDVGYLEWDRNPYWNYAANLKTGGGIDNGDPLVTNLPYRQIIRLTGSTSAGVAASVYALLNRHILTGAIAPGDKMPDGQSLWTIDQTHFAAPEKAPGWIPTQDLKAGDLSLTFAGWQIADAMTYSGFQDAAGVPAQQIWRAKYLTEKGWNYPPTVAIDPSHPMTRSPLFEASFARRASDNEWFVAKFAAAAEATQAAEGLEKTLNSRRDYSHAPWTDQTVEGVTWRRSRFGLNLRVQGQYLVMESFDAAHDDLALRAISQGMVRQP